MSIARSSRPLRSMTIGINGMGRSPVEKRSARMNGNADGPGGSPIADFRIPDFKNPGPLRDRPSRSAHGALGGLGGGDVADDLVDQAVFLGLDRGHVAVALGV